MIEKYFDKLKGEIPDDLFKNGQGFIYFSDDFTMNKSKEFLLGKLKELYDSFDGIKIQYEFDEHIDLHLIEVLPLDTFENDNNFILEEIKIQDEFEALFGETEEILFVSSDSLNEIKSPAMKFGYKDK